MSITGFTAALGRTAEVEGEADFESSPASAAATTRHKEEKAKIKRHPPAINTSRGTKYQSPSVSEQNDCHFQTSSRNAMIKKSAKIAAQTRSPHSSVAQWQSIRLLTGGL